MRKSYKKQAPKLRFFRKVQVDEATGCWEWTGHKRACGHGIFTLTAGGKTVRVQAHRYALELQGVNVPIDKRVHHSCNNASCVNPVHLFMSADDKPPRGGTVDDKRAGENNAASVLGDGDATMIRLLRAHSNWPVSKLAEAFGVEEATIYKILSGRSRVTVRERVVEESIISLERQPA